MSNSYHPDVGFISVSPLLLTEALVSDPIAHSTLTLRRFSSRHGFPHMTPL
jgi:hypothetical protein